MYLERSAGQRVQIWNMSDPGVCAPRQPACIQSDLRASGMQPTLPRETATSVDWDAAWGVDSGEELHIHQFVCPRGNNCDASKLIPLGGDAAGGGEASDICSNHLNIITKTQQLTNPTVLACNGGFMLSKGMELPSHHTGDLWQFGAWLRYCLIP